ncbi:cytochrome P450 97B3 [Magnaporthiopsis poae ATCC 64411]|uniref:Cytochrome P450 97B3 n=1 Tax=Magnaporthiopsis poae (strain ATCC 64411 / 73-15) TaxID=644358 RepID=A0A0C4DMY9_MAGP6|nr:cytochrome P450 97B3 [Magnaporthiopsis poae ATCC 64411]
MLATAIKRNWRPWRPASLVFVGVVAYAVTWRRGEWSKSAFLTTFSGAWLLTFAAWSVWMNQLYPKLFSPLRHLPGPKDNSFFNGQQARISKEPTGAPMVDWFNSIPNDGLIRYLSILNLERLAPTSAKALQEILVTKNYDFEKPSDFRHTIGRILGVGILLAEGDEHKGQRRALNPAFAFRHIKDLPVSVVVARLLVVMRKGGRRAEEGLQAAAGGNDVSEAERAAAAVAAVRRGWAGRGRREERGLESGGRGGSAVRRVAGERRGQKHGGKLFARCARSGEGCIVRAL